MATVTPLDKAKLNLMLDPDCAFYASIMCALEYTEDATLKYRAATDGKRIIFNPDKNTDLNDQEMEGLLLHELLHVVMQHPVRVMPDIKRWQTACDYWINSHITKDLGRKIPKGGLLSSTYTSAYSVEQIYKMLEEDQDKTESPEPDIIPNDSSEDKEEIEEMIVRAVTMAQMQGEGKAYGNIPQDALRLVEKILKPKVDYRILFQRYMSAKAKEGHSWKRRSRRYRNIYMPSRYSEKMGEFHFYIDGSCSVSDKDFSMQVSQIHWIWENLKPSKIKIIIFNTRIVDIFEFNADEQIKVKFKARGGTDIREIRDMMLQENPECSVIYTDGYFRQHDFSKIKHDVLWLIYNNSTFSHPVGKVIHI